MIVKATKLILISWVLTGVLGSVLSTPCFSAESKEALPVLYDEIPSRLYKILGPVGVGQKTISETRSELRKQAVRLDADAVIGVRCEAGGFRRQGLTWEKRQAYCRGIAVQFLDSKDGEVPSTPKVAP